MTAPKLVLFLGDLGRRVHYLLPILLVLSCGGQEVPADLPQTMEWRFDEPQPDWKVAIPWNPALPPAETLHTGDALRITLKDSVITADGEVYWSGGIYTDLPDLMRAEWDSVEVRVRTEVEPFRSFVGFNLKEGSGTSTSNPLPFEADENIPPLTPDGRFLVQSPGAQQPRHPLCAVGSEGRHVSLGPKTFMGRRVGQQDRLPGRGCPR